MLKRFIERRVAAAIEERGYTNLILAGLEATVEGRQGDIQSTSALEIAARMWAGALAGATVSGTELLTPRYMAMIGRQIVRAGEIVFAIEVRDGRPMLLPASAWEVLSGWRYRVDLPNPPGETVTRTLQRESVLHAMFAVHPRNPWRGVAPMAVATTGAELAANIESRLRDQAKTPAAVLIPVPEDGGESSLDQLRTDIGNARGDAVLVESTVGGWEREEGGAGARPSQSDWEPKALGPMIDDGARELNEDGLQRVLAACGIPGSLASVGADGTQLREDYRRFIMLTVEPWAKELAAEASEKLDADISFSFEGLWAHDFAGRATAVQKLVAAGVNVSRALAIAGLSEG